ncbi:MAG: NAD(P)H-hydrate dehydratase [Pyrinomonadaceae bacterium]
MIKILTAKQMQEVDRQTVEECNLKSIDLMETAAGAVVENICEIFGNQRKKRAVVFCGPGNNGGDGAAISRLLYGFGWNVTAVLSCEIINTRGDARTKFERLSELQGATGFRIIEVSQLCEFLGSEILCDLCVDAIFGTGLSRSVEGSFLSIIEKINSMRKTDLDLTIIAVDIPSGLDSDSEVPIGAHVFADYTVSFTAPKLANVFPPASRSNGIVKVAEIGSPPRLVDKFESENYLITEDDLAGWMNQTQFSADSYKGARGSVLIIAGSKNYSGAPVLAANAAVRSGAGLVTLVVPNVIREEVASRISPEVMIHECDSAEDGTFGEGASKNIEELLKRADAILIGCGLDAKGRFVTDLVNNVIKTDSAPLVIDADGLNAIAPLNSPLKRKNTVLLTPHIGEFRRLSGNEAVENRIEELREFACAVNANILLKGEASIIASTNGRIAINAPTSPAVGKGGAGDTLSGLITGFVAQGARFSIEPFTTCAAAIYFAGLAGKCAEEKFGGRVMIPSDVRDCFSDVFKRFEI